MYSLNIVPELPPAPADLVDVGRAFRTDSLWSAAARRRRAVRGPPGGRGEDWRFTVDAELPVAAPVFPVDFSLPESGPEARGDVEA